MPFLLVAVIVTLVTLLSFGIVFLLIAWSVHRSMTIYSTNSWNYGTFGKFELEFKKRSWKKNDLFPSSLFSDDGSKLHANIVAFDTKGMVLYPWSYLKMFLFLRPKSKRKKTLWC